jgi:hypothetical protein
VPDINIDYRQCEVDQFYQELPTDELLRLISGHGIPLAPGYGLVVEALKRLEKVCTT